MDRKIMVEVTKEELDLLDNLDKEVTLVDLINSLVSKLGEQEPTKRLSNADPITKESVVCKVYELEDCTIRYIAREPGEPEITIFFKPKRKK